MLEWAHPVRISPGAACGRTHPFWISSRWIREDVRWVKRGMCARDAGSRQNTEIFLRSFNRPAQIRAFLTLSQGVTGHRTAAPPIPFCCFSSSCSSTSPTSTTLNTTQKAHHDPPRGTRAPIIPHAPAKQSHRSPITTSSTRPSRRRPRSTRIFICIDCSLPTLRPADRPLSTYNSSISMASASVSPPPIAKCPPHSCFP